MAALHQYRCPDGLNLTWETPFSWRRQWALRRSQALGRRSEREYKGIEEQASARLQSVVDRRSARLIDRPTLRARVMPTRQLSSARPTNRRAARGQICGAAPKVERRVLIRRAGGVDWASTTIKRTRLVTRRLTRPCWPTFCARRSCTRLASVPSGSRNRTILRKTIPPQT